MSHKKSSNEIRHRLNDHTLNYGIIEVALFFTAVV